MKTHDEITTWSNFALITGLTLAASYLPGATAFPEDYNPGLGRD